MKSTIMSLIVATGIFSSSIALAKTDLFYCVENNDLGARPDSFTIYEDEGKYFLKDTLEYNPIQVPKPEIKDGTFKLDYYSQDRKTWAFIYSDKNSTYLDINLSTFSARGSNISFGPNRESWRCSLEAP
jgi:hypothetical protein